MITALTAISVQGWSSVIPIFKPLDFVSLYLEIPVMLLMYLAWFFFSKSTLPSYSLVGEHPSPLLSATDRTPLLRSESPHTGRRAWYHDVVDTWDINLYSDEYEEEEEDFADDLKREARLQGRAGWLWNLYYWIL